MDLLHVAVIALAGFGAGILNTTSGGGTILTLPALLFLGLPATVANGTNRVAILVQSVSAVSVFRKSGLVDFKLAGLLSIPSLIGCLIGAGLALDMSDAQFRKFLGAMLLIVLAFILWRPKVKEPQAGQNAGLGRKIALWASFFAIGLYGGLIMAGIGFLIIGAFSLISGMDVVRANAHKVFIIGIFNISGMLVFVLSGQVDWPAGLILATGQGLGAWVGSVMAVRKGERFIRAFLVTSVIFVSLKLFGWLPF